MANFSLAAFLRAGSVAMIAALGIAGSVRAHSASNRFEVNASLSPAMSVQSGTLSGTGIDLRARLSAGRKSQAGGGYSLVASVTSPFGCADDTIFEDGFDP